MRNGCSKGSFQTWIYVDGHPELSGCPFSFDLVVQNDMEQRAVNLQPTVVVDKSQFSEPVHEETNPRAGGADHFPSTLG